MNRFDICEAYYLYAMLYHGGQGCVIYTIFAKLDGLGFVPSPILSQRSHLSDYGKVIYDNLVANGYKGVNTNTQGVQSCKMKTNKYTD